MADHIRVSRLSQDCKKGWGVMWCSYEETICLNPLCIGGCVSLSNDRKASLDAAKVLVELVRVVKGDKDNGTK